VTAETLIATLADVGSLPIGVVVTRLDGIVAGANPAATVAGFRVGSQVWSHSRQLEAAWPRLATIGGHAAVEVAGPDGDRVVRFVAERRSYEGEWYLVVCVIALTDRDDLTESITESSTQRSADQLRITSNERLESLGLVAGGVAHEFNNQLVSVVAEASMLREDDTLGHEPREAAARRMTLLTKQLLAFAGRGRFVTALLDPDLLLADTRHRLTRMVPPTVTLTIEPTAPEIAIEADRSLLRQVILDLVENAVDAVRGAGAIRVTSAIRDHAWELAISDDGIGMDAATRDRMFDPFFSTKADHRGLGLSAVLGIVRRLGGDITSTSEAGAGTTLRVRLPIVAGVQAPRRRSTSKQTPIAKLTGLKILVADDEPSVRQTIQRFLIRRGAVPMIACDGGEAEQLLRAEHFDVVLLDVMMPKKTGYQLVSVVRETQPGSPVVLMSGYSEQPDSAEPADGFIEKPFNVSALEGTLQAVMLGDVPRLGTEEE
jgi:two-component system cell cycle sensor histidine kinase/response regulator CckA